MSKIPEIEIYITGKELKRIDDFIDRVRRGRKTDPDWEWTKAEIKVTGSPNYRHVPQIIKELKAYHQLNKLKE